MVAGLLTASEPAWALDNGPTITGDVCMQEVYASPVENSNRLNCTANDIRLSRATAVDPDSCIENSTFDLTATFEIEVTANARYDAGFFFRIDGGDTARGDEHPDTHEVQGTCSLSGLTPDEPPAYDLDTDTCGDLNAGLYEVTFTIPNVKCVGVEDPENPGQKILKLPNCTSWHNNQGTECTISEPSFTTADALYFHADTRSKCVCDDDFTVPVIVETASLTTTKSAVPTTVPETGQYVTYTVSVKSDAQYVSVEITSLVDDLYGDLTELSDSCAALVGVVLEPGDEAECTFQGWVSGDADDQVKDTVMICGEQVNTGAEICDDDEAIVTITDECPNPALTKTPKSSALADCTLTVEVTYEVGISNTSTVDTLTVKSLTDDRFGDITEVQGDVLDTTCVPDTDLATCEVGGTIAPENSCSCTFTARVTGGSVEDGACKFSHEDEVTGVLTDDDEVTCTRSDGATVSVSADVKVSF
jgi:hypothetical protein